MDIKRLNNGGVNWPRDPAADSAGGTKPESEIGNDASPAGPLDNVGASYRRADLTTDKFSSILRQSIDALLDSAAASGTVMPPGVRQKAADYLAADPLFASRVRTYWEKNLN
jgi:hypothetical protein